MQAIFLSFPSSWDRRRNQHYRAGRSGLYIPGPHKCCCVSLPLSSKTSAGEGNYYAALPLLRQENRQYYYHCVFVVVLIYAVYDYQFLTEQLAKASVQIDIRIRWQRFLGVVPSIPEHLSIGRHATARTGF